MTDKALSRIAALLRKAEATDNEHEADAYLQAAQRLATLSAVDLAVARSHTARRERRATPTQRTIVVGAAGKRGLRTYVHLFLAIGRANNLTCDIARDSTQVFAYGFDTDIDTVEAMYASLVVQMVRASDVYIKSGAYAGELVPKRVRVEGSARWNRWLQGYEYDHEWVAGPVHATTARINFQQAFAARIGERLQAIKREAEQHAVQESSAGRGSGVPGAGMGSATGGGVHDGRDAGGQAAPSVAVVLRAREVELAEHYRAHSRARGSWSGNRASAGYSEQSRRAGDRAGRQARLGGERAIGGARPGIAAGHG